MLAGAVRGVAAGTKNPRTQEYILTTAQTVSLITLETAYQCMTLPFHLPPRPPPPPLQVMDQSVSLIQEAKVAVEDPTAPNKQVRLAQAAKAVSQALNQVRPHGVG